MKKQIAKCIKEISSGAYSPQVVFFDWMQCLALSISNTCTLIHNDLWKKREEQYLSTIRKYDKEARYKMSDMVGMLTATYISIRSPVKRETSGGNLYRYGREDFNPLPRKEGDAEDNLYLGSTRPEISSRILVSMVWL